MLQHGMKCAPLVGPPYRPLEVGGALFPMSTLSKSSETGSAREGPNGSDVANGLSALGLPNMLTLALERCRVRFARPRLRLVSSLLHGTREKACERSFSYPPGPGDLAQHNSGDLIASGGERLLVPYEMCASAGLCFHISRPAACCSQPVHGCGSFLEEITGSF